MKEEKKKKKVFRKPSYLHESFHTLIPKICHGVPFISEEPKMLFKL